MLYWHIPVLEERSEDRHVENNLTARSQAVCVCERERDGGREREGERQRWRERGRIERGSSAGRWSGQSAGEGCKAGGRDTSVWNLRMASITYGINFCS